MKMAARGKNRKKGELWKHSGTIKRGGRRPCQEGDGSRLEKKYDKGKEVAFIGSGLGENHSLTEEQKKNVMKKKKPLRHRSKKKGLLAASKRKGMNSRDTKKGR